MMNSTYLDVSEREHLRGIRKGLVPTSEYWSKHQATEAKVHRIHAYPAKFPAFIAVKAFEEAKAQGLRVKRVADVFCGCGTTAFEAHKAGYDFWGCDLNPVATLIARTKRSDYTFEKISHYLKLIEKSAASVDAALVFSDAARDRLNYWHDSTRFQQLSALLQSINVTVPHRSRYRAFFHCAFSNILKPTSRWLTKSIKPQIDPKKLIGEVLPTFRHQVAAMAKAFQKDSPKRSTQLSKIETANVLTCKFPHPVDLLITSPPYVTSYEYADLHQLSALWLGYADDYRDLRCGSIGSSQHDLDFDREIKRLNETGSRVVFSLFDRDRATARAVANYYLDMQAVAERCRQMVRKNGLALFVIGDTEYKGVKIENAEHLTESLLDAGFSKVRLAKRTISSKILTPFRTDNGRFTRSSAGRRVYSEEFVLIAQR